MSSLNVMIELDISKRGDGLSRQIETKRAARKLYNVAIPEMVGKTKPGGSGSRFGNYGEGMMMMIRASERTVTAR
jgi:hypothetical protein